MVAGDGVDHRADVHAGAARVADQTAFFSLDSSAYEPSGTLVEFTDTATMFTNPADPRTRDYVTGRFG